MARLDNDAAMISKSLDGRITAWNAAAERMFGFPAEEALGKHISIIIPFDYQDEEYELLDRLKQEDFLEVRCTVRRAKSGEFFEVMLSATPIRDEAGKIIGATKMVQRLTPAQSEARANETVLPPQPAPTQTPG
ncbi:MAG: PAS domain-containing protein [Alphaproteobacteria bacterium]